MHCQLIEMGEMACYQEFCPHCGRIPPSRRSREDQFLEAQEYQRRLVVLDANRQQTEKHYIQQQQQQQQHYQQRSKATV